MDSPHAWFTAAVGHYLLLVWVFCCAGALTLAAAAWIWGRVRRKLPFFRKLCVIGPDLGMALPDELRVGSLRKKGAT